MQLHVKTPLIKRVQIRVLTKSAKLAHKEVTCLIASQVTQTKAGDLINQSINIAAPDYSGIPRDQQYLAVLLATYRST
jgi:hypothetical protein